MEPYFPADVSLRVTGEIGDAQKLFPVAKQLLSRAVRLKETGQPVVRLFLPGSDGSLIYAFLHRDMKHLYVQPGKHAKPEKEVIGKREPLITEACPDMLSGIVYPGTGVVIGEDEYSLHAYHPTGVFASVYEFAFEWQDVERLGVVADPALTGPSGSSVKMQVRWPKPSMYTGPMKRVVQAIYGSGKQG